MATLTKRQQTIRANKAAAERLARHSAAVADEGARFNEAIRAGAVVMLPTFSGSYRVQYVDQDFFYHTDGNGGFGQSWAGCNNAVWADLLQQAGIERNPLYR
jgi:hypothetical protein